MVYRLRTSYVRTWTKHQKVCKSMTIIITSTKWLECRSSFVCKKFGSTFLKFYFYVTVYLIVNGLRYSRSPGNGYTASGWLLPETISKLIRAYHVYNRFQNDLNFGFLLPNKYCTKLSFPNWPVSKTGFSRKFNLNKD